MRQRRTDIKQLLIYHLIKAPDSITNVRGIMKKTSASSSLRELEKEGFSLPATPNGYNYC